MSLAELEARQDPTAELTRLIRASPPMYEEAFGAALHRGDLGTVVWLCRQVDAAAVFANDEPALSQSILLSLMQQLSSDLAQDVGTKLAWIREAAMALDPTDPQLAPHMRGVLEHVAAGLAAVAAAPGTPAADLETCRYVRHNVRGLLRSCPP